mgnify:CR=1 FL=1
MMAIILYISVGVVHSQAQWSVDFTIKTPSFTPAGSSFFLTGESKSLCQWKVKCHSLKEIAPHIYRVVLNFPETIKKVKFKVTRGEWSSESTNSFGAAHSNFEVEKTKRNQRVIVNIANWKDLPNLGRSDNIRIIKDFYSKELGYSKDLHIYLPSDYLKYPNRKYPVIYMHDGHNLFNPHFSSFGKVWSVDRAMGRFENTQQAIIVGMSSDLKLRYDEYDYFRTGREYARFVVNTVKPFIDKSFRTKIDRENTSLMGSSMGALISLTMLWDYPHIFSKAAGLSIPAFIHQGSIFRFLKNRASAPKDIAFYMDHGGFGIDAKYERHVKKLQRVLVLKKGLKKTQLKYFVFPLAGHNEIDWARRVSTPLRFLLAK